MSVDPKSKKSLMRASSAPSMKVGGANADVARPGTVGITIYQDPVMAKSGPLPENKSSEALPFKNESLSKIFKKKIVGDLFGTNATGDNGMLGLMYRSRIESKRGIDKSLKNSVNIKIEDSSDIIYDNSMDLDDEQDDNGIDNTENMQELNPRQQLAVTIRNWSLNKENDHSLIQEGAVHAVIALAGMDDALIKKCCASALYQLSSRVENKERLLSLGAANGAISLSLQVKSWKIAKLCAMTLCNLSMVNSFEGGIAKDGGILALVVLMSIKGHHLLPICVQTLYNLTCVDNYYKGMERTLKAVMNLPHSDFDSISFVIKSFVNCSRFSWMRLRMIEDGAITLIGGYTASLSVASASSGKLGADFKHREPNPELLENVIITLRLLSESSGCRAELLSKGTIDVLQCLLPYCETYGHLVVLLIKSVHNLLQGTVLNIVQFEHALAIVTTCIAKAGESNHDNIVLQYASACIHMFSKDSYRNSAKLTIKVVDCLPKLLRQNNQYTQFFSLVSTSLMFFNPLCTEKSKDVEVLLKGFVACGLKATDLENTKVFCLSLARLLQDPVYIHWLEKLGFLDAILDHVLEMLNKFNEDISVQEAGCICICRIAMKLKTISDTIKESLASILLNMLDRDSLFLLENAISSVYSLGGQGSCQKQILTDELLLKVARIVSKYNSQVDLCRICCAALAVFSQNPVAHTGLAADEVLKMLFATITAKDVPTREFVATTICNMTTNEFCREKLVDWGVIDCISTLSGATNENIQDLCAKCICNLTHSELLHKRILDQKILETISMISLVRASKASTKRLCARALLNLVLDDNMQALFKAEAIRIFAVLSNIDCEKTQHTCARGFLLFTLNEERCKELSNHFSIMQTIIQMVTLQEVQTRTLIGFTVCNLLERQPSQLPVIKAGGLSILKIISTMENDALQEAASRIVINLSLDASLHQYLVNEPIVEMLLSIIQKKSGPILECALNALSCMSHSEFLRAYLIDSGCVHCLVNVILNGKINTVCTALEAMRCLTCLTYERSKVYAMVCKAHIILALHVLTTADADICSSQMARMALIALKNLSFDSHVVPVLIEQDSVSLIKHLMQTHRKVRNYLAKAAVIFIHNLSLVDKVHDDLVFKGAIDILNTLIVSVASCGGKALSQKLKESPHLSVSRRSVAPDHNKHHNSNHHVHVGQSHKIIQDLADEDVSLNSEEVFYLVRSLNIMCDSSRCHKGLIQHGAILMFVKLYSFPETKSNSSSCLEIACALSKLASSESCREKMVADGASWLLSDISHCSQLKTQKMCLLALGYLSSITQVKSGNVAAALLLSLKVEGGNAAGGVTDSNGNQKADHIAKMLNIQSLNEKIKEGIQAKSDVHGIYANEDVQSHDPEIEQTMVLDILHKPDYIYTMRSEHEYLRGNHSRYVYECVPHRMSPKSGGVARNNLVLLALPSITVERAVTIPNLHDSLEKIPLRKDCLTKDFRSHDPSKYDGKNFDYENCTTTAIGDKSSPSKDSHGDSNDKKYVNFSPDGSNKENAQQNAATAKVKSKWSILKKSIGL